jgi:hypothetical protein
MESDLELDYDDTGLESFFPDPAEGLGLSRLCGLNSEDPLELQPSTEQDPEDPRATAQHRTGPPGATAQH